MQLLRSSWWHVFADWRRAVLAMRVARRSGTPVLLAATAPGRDYKTVLVATDFSEASLCAAQAAARVAPAAHFIFVHAYRLPDERLMREMDLRPDLVKMYRERGRQAARQRLAACLDRFSPPLPSADCLVEYGSPGHVIEECARRHGADLIVIGA